MAENDVIINPSNPQPAPAPAPAPAGPSGITPDELKRDIALISSMLHGISTFLPGGLKTTMAKLLTLLDMAQSQEWAFNVLTELLNRLQGTQASPEHFSQAILESLVASGQKQK